MINHVETFNKIQFSNIDSDYMFEKHYSRRDVFSFYYIYQHWNLLGVILVVYCSLLFFQRFCSNYINNTMVLVVAFLYGTCTIDIISRINDGWISKNLKMFLSLHYH